MALADGGKVAYDRLLLATGAEPVRLPIPGADQPHVHTLRTLADSRAIIERAKTARRAVVIGASFIGLEVAASLRAREHRGPCRGAGEAADGARPRARRWATSCARCTRSTASSSISRTRWPPSTASRSKLKSGGTLEADLVVMGVGVRPRLDLAEKAGLTLDRGVVVDAFLETSAPGIFAAGDIARWPDPHSGQAIRVEHWVVAERQGQTAALNMLGLREKFDAVPFFWSQHYDIPINYVGHAEKWDELAVDGDIAGKDCLLRFKLDGRTLAVASIFRDVASLQAEVAMERDMAASPSAR